MTFDKAAIPFDRGRHYRAKIGFVLLATEQTVQQDVMRLAPEGVGIHTTRAANPDSITNDTLAAQADLLADCASTLLPDGSLDVICYACTSGSLVIGEERVFAELNRGAPGGSDFFDHGRDQGTQAVKDTKDRGRHTYLDEISRREAKYMTQAGFDILSIDGLNLERDSDMVRVPPDFLVDYALAQDQPDADAIFISCGALRTLDVIEEIEQRAGKPRVL